MSSFPRIILLRNVAFVLAVAAADGRTVNISNTWFLPRERFPFFYRYFPEKVTWDTAQSICDNHHGTIVVPDDISKSDVLQAYLKELDVVSHVWLGLAKVSQQNTFVWTSGEPLTGDGLWLQQIPQSTLKLCVAADPTVDFRWIAYRCGGPETASFVCQLSVPRWAENEDGCMISQLPSLSITFEPETGVVELISDCGLSGTRRIACKGPINRDDVIKHLSCDEDPFTDPSITEKAKENTPRSTTAKAGNKDASTETTKGWSWTSTERLTRHKRNVSPTTSANITLTDIPH